MIDTTGAAGYNRGDVRANDEVAGSETSPP